MLPRRFCRNLKLASRSIDSQNRPGIIPPLATVAFRGGRRVFFDNLAGDSKEIE